MSKRIACPDGCLIEERPDHLPEDATPMCPVCGRRMITIKEDEE